MDPYDARNRGRSKRPRTTTDQETEPASHHRHQSPYPPLLFDIPRMTFGERAATPPPWNEQNADAVIDLTDDNDTSYDDEMLHWEEHHHHHMPWDPFPLPLLGAITNLLERRSRAPRVVDKRDYSSLMDYYGGGYWAKNREKTEKSQKNSSAPEPPKQSSASSNLPSNNQPPTNSSQTITSSSSVQEPNSSNPIVQEPTNSSNNENNTGTSEMNEGPAATAKRRRRQKATASVSATNTTASTSSVSSIQPSTETTSSTESSAMSNAATSNESVAAPQATSGNDPTNSTEPDIPVHPPSVSSQTSLFKDFQCVVCLDKVKDVTATFCGHVFCEECILLAIQSSERCPTCRCKLSTREVHPLFV